MRRIKAFEKKMHKHSHTNSGAMIFFKPNVWKNKNIVNNVANGWRLHKCVRTPARIGARIYWGEGKLINWMERQLNAKFKTIRGIWALRLSQTSFSISFENAVNERSKAHMFLVARRLLMPLMFINLIGLIYISACLYVCCAWIVLY